MVNKLIFSFLLAATIPVTMAADQRDAVEFSIDVIDADQNTPLTGVQLEFGEFVNRGALRLRSYSPIAILKSNEAGKIYAKVWTGGDLYVRIWYEDGKKEWLLVTPQAQNLEFKKSSLTKPYRLEMTLKIRRISKSN